MSASNTGLYTEYYAEKKKEVRKNGCDWKSVDGDWFYLLTDNTKMIYKYIPDRYIYNAIKMHIYNKYV